MEKDEIIIRNAIVHILDSTIGMPVLSDTLLELGPDLNDFLRGHIYKIASSDDVKSCQFNKEESIVYHILEEFNEDNLIQISHNIASHLYGIMNQNIDITPADLLVVTYQVNSTLHLALLKMNYKESYIHITGSDVYGNSNDIIKQKATLPSEGTKLSEAVLINLLDYSIELVEKKYEINGVKTNYLSQIFLQCMGKLSPKAKLNIVTKAMEQIHQKYYEEDFDKHMEAKSILHNEYIEQGVINTSSLGEKIFKENPEIREEFVEKLEKYNIEADEVKPRNKQTTRKFEKQFLTTDTGIEINIPMDQYNNKNNIEFITNPDGTISVLIKNINHITSK
ncbi:nucleoid associated protein NdpA [Mobilisporobacter senegalensis]|uniref:Nucleoid associated protein NdpA n=1 Tax=Mobilisporobacter senegalensis TaxID=1329262 RepID=A0A3N1XTP9_9FIRM|nr:nucleoid-associated protein [Mobilisporobacter senegalensis]ROR28247.1 nucleoid associated protein NdpA [Mobilisporobacter senegalensis]